MHFLDHDGFRIAYVDEGGSVAGGGEPVLLIHGFASTHFINWVSPGWVKTLRDGGYRVIALDNRGHGQSSKSYDPEDYRPERMAGDAAALLGNLGITRAHVFGYSMGARISAVLALLEPGLVATLTFGGLGIGMVDGVLGGEAIRDALLADDPQAGVDDQSRRFRAFADKTKSDRRALAACIETSRVALPARDVARITQPTLIAVGTKDDVGGDPEALAALMPQAVAFHIEDRDHMLAVGDRSFKKRVLEFLAEHPL